MLDNISIAVMQVIAMVLIILNYLQSRKMKKRINELEKEKQKLKEIQSITELPQE